MATAKPPYRGGNNSFPPLEIPDLFKRRLRELYPGNSHHSYKTAFAEFTNSDPADYFAQQLLYEACWAKGELVEERQSLNKQEIRAELDDLQKALKIASGKLRRISPEVDLLLGAASDPPQEWADALERVIEQLEGAKKATEELHRKRKDTKREIAIELAIRISRVLQRYGIKLSTDPGSTAVKIFQTVGDAIGLVWSEYTWADILAKAKRRTKCQ